MKKPRAVLYARISTTEKRQNWRAQLQELRRVADQRGWSVAAEYHDVTSGRKSDRPGLKSAVDLCRSGGAEIFASVSVDRVARSTVHFLNFLANLDAYGTRAAFTRDGAYDATTPMGQAMQENRATFAQLEARLIGERIKESLAIKKANGVKLGAPRRYDYRRLPTVIKLRRKKVPWKEIAQRFGGTHGGWERAVVRFTKGDAATRAPKAAA